jgi:CRISPR-associated protein Cas2
MKRYDFVISYDIADEKRLRRTAKILEREGVRFQYSIYLLHRFTKMQLQELLEKVLSEIDEKEDDVRVYRIADYGIKLGNALDLANPYDIV